MDDRLDLSAEATAYTRDPYPLLRRIQAETGVSQVLVDGLPAWLLTRYDDVRAACSDPRLSVDASHGSAEVRAIPWVATRSESVLTRHMLRTDPPAHGRLRALVSKALTPRRIQLLRPRIQQGVDQLIDAFAPVGHADLVREYALPLPLIVICELLGIPEADRPEVVNWTNTYAGVNVGDAARIPQVLAAMQAYLSDLITAREQAGPADSDGGSLLDGLIAARDGTGRLTHDEVHAMVFLLIMAGFETTANLISNGVLALLIHPDQLAVVRRGGVPLAGAIEEFLRYEPPVKISAAVRFAKEDIEIGGVKIRTGDAVMFSYAAVNHDPARFAEPDRFDVTRPELPHLAFGHGIHYCLGAPLARLEAEVALGTLLRRCPDLALAVPVDALVWRHSRLIRGLRELPVSFSPNQDPLHPSTVDVYSSI